MSKDDAKHKAFLAARSARFEKGDVSMAEATKISRGIAKRVMKKAIKPRKKKRK